ncbi:MAG: OmpH family outer membrane protein, partial [Desulfovibrio sp.]|nr:OmpH family outer membrane protein [Desulfovibrio sp.]
LLVLLSGCLPWEKQQPPLAVVDVERVLRDSRAARAGRDHVEAAKARLQQGWQELQEAAKNEPEGQRQKTLAQGLQTLQRQIRAEEIGARQIVNNLLLEEVKKWRRVNKVEMIIARQNLLDASGARDVTQAVIEAMDAREVQFAELPVVTVNAAAQNAAGQEGEKTAKPTEPRPRGETGRQATGGRAR